ncbi:PHP-associated domain-containing protein [Clostridium sp. Cult3]|uniref:PHP-associated domain-containing protein n=1 Tax=Clostridium sp. Cult3 TaxID=2079004 RepID=UPI001F426976|nr:PHP domain-containing protein [Clostridium sp. Cult3]MCF6460716.1 histidinol-phosphatase [Clostridium sp. Cult3]
MIIDTHIHENKYSPDSFIDLEKAIDMAKITELDAICITNHDNNYLRKDIGDSAKINGVLVIVGTEVLTYQGDILVFGLKDIPKEMLHAEELLDLVRKHNGVAIAAHPFRNNNRGLENHLHEVGHLLSGVESFNGSTYTYHNLYAYATATELGLPSLGASDAHVIDRIGMYATKFYNTIRDHKDFIEAIKSKDFHPVMRKDGRYVDFDYCYETILPTKEAVDAKYR